VKTTQRPKGKSGAIRHDDAEGMTALERWMITGGIVLALILAVGFGLFQFALARYQATPDPESFVIKPDYPRHLIDFSLTDQTGHTVTRNDLIGKIAVVNFVFTSCTLTCAYVNAQMVKIQSRTSPADVRLVSLILNPDDNSTAALAQYSQTYRPVSGHWSFLTGDEASLHRLIGTSFLPKDTTGQFSYMPGNFAHTQRIALLDSRGHLVSYFDGLNQNAANAVLDEIKKLQNHD
jgi:protein SCO1/2